MKTVRTLRGLPLLLLLASCMPTPGFVAPVGAGWTSPAGHHDVEYQIHEIVNGERRMHGLAPLVLDPHLAEIARDHSRAMATGLRPFGHDHFRERARTVRTVLPSSRAVGENVASNLQTRSAAGQHVVRQWLSSQGHRKQIHDPGYTVTGIGVSEAANGELFFTQIFVEKQPAALTSR